MFATLIGTDMNHDHHDSNTNRASGGLVTDLTIHAKTSNMSGTGRSLQKEGFKKPRKDQDKGRLLWFPLLSFAFLRFSLLSYSFLWFPTRPVLPHEETRSKPGLPAALRDAGDFERRADRPARRCARSLGCDGRGCGRGRGHWPAIRDVGVARRVRVNRRFWSLLPLQGAILGIPVF